LAVPSRTEAAIVDILEDGPWDDHLDLRFRAPRENGLCALNVETYHGIGGSWGPAKDGGSERIERSHRL
jgi:hypothetical protein